MRNYSTIIYAIIIFLLPSSNIVTADEATSPNLGDPYSDILPLNQEYIIGFSAYRTLQKYNLIINDPLVTSYIGYLGNLLSRNTLDSRRSYTFFITKTRSVNAFAIPGGFIGINTGLMNLTSNEAQLAGVLAHEIGHIKLRHTAEMIANAPTNSIAMWIGLMAGLLSGNADAGIVALKAGLGISTQQNINLIRSNEVESDEFGIDLLRKSRFDIMEMAKFFSKMSEASGGISQEMEYFSTHPMYENRISLIKSKSINQENSIISTTEDYYYVKNIVEVASIKDVDYAISSIENDKPYGSHKKALLYMKKSEYKKAKALIIPLYKKYPNNIYFVTLYSRILNYEKNFEKSIDVLTNLKNNYPTNNVISFKLAETFIENQINLDYAEKLLKSIESEQRLNPNYLRLMSKLYVYKNNIYNSKLYLSEFHLMVDNLDLAVQVIDDGLNSYKLSSRQILALKEKKRQIICTYQRPLEPIFGEKTCN